MTQFNNNALSTTSRRQSDGAFSPESSTVDAQDTSKPEERPQLVPTTTYLIGGRFFAVRVMPLQMFPLRLALNLTTSPDPGSQEPTKPDERPLHNGPSTTLPLC